MVTPDPSSWPINASQGIPFHDVANGPGGKTPDAVGLGRTGRGLQGPAAFLGGSSQRIRLMRGPPQNSLNNQPF